VRSQRPFPDDSLQWKHITEAKRRKYEQALDLFFAFNAAQKLDFTCLIVERKRIDHARFSASDGELSFQKMVYQTYMAILRKYGKPDVLRGFHGRRDSPFSLSEFLRIFNDGASKEQLPRHAFYRPMRQMEYMNPGKSDLHQVADLLLGAASWHWNRNNRGGPSTPKGMVARYTEAHCPLDCLHKAPPKTLYCPQFHLWEFDWKIAARKPRSAN